MGTVTLSAAQRAQVLAQAAPRSTILRAETIGSGREIQVITSGAHIGQEQIIKIQPSGEAVRTGGFVSDAEARMGFEEAKKLPSKQSPLTYVQGRIVGGTIQRTGEVKRGKIDSGKPQAAFRANYGVAPPIETTEEVTTTTKSYTEYTKPGSKGIIRDYSGKKVKQPTTFFDFALKPFKASKDYLISGEGGKSRKEMFAMIGGAAIHTKDIIKKPFETGKDYLMTGQGSKTRKEMFNMVKGGAIHTKDIIKKSFEKGKQSREEMFGMVKGAAIHTKDIIKKPLKIAAKDTYKLGKWTLQYPFKAAKGVDVEVRKVTKVFDPFREKIIYSSDIGSMMTGSKAKTPSPFQAGVKREVYEEVFDRPASTAVETVGLYGTGKIIGTGSKVLLLKYPAKAPGVMKWINRLALGGYTTSTAYELSKQTPEERGQFAFKEGRRVTAVLAGVASVEPPKPKVEYETKRFKVTKEVTEYETVGGFESELPQNTAHAKLKQSGLDKPPKWTEKYSKVPDWTKKYDKPPYTKPDWSDPRWKPTPLKSKALPKDLSRAKITFIKPKVVPTTPKPTPKPKSDIPKGYKAVKTKGGLIQLQKMEPLKTKTKSFSKLTITQTKVKQIQNTLTKSELDKLFPPKQSLKQKAVTKTIDTFKTVKTAKVTQIQDVRLRPLFQPLTQTNQMFLAKQKQKTTTKTTTKQKQQQQQKPSIDFAPITKTKSDYKLGTIQDLKIKHDIITITKPTTITKPDTTTTPKPLITIIPTTITTTRIRKITDKITEKKTPIIPGFRFNLKSGKKGLSLSKSFKIKRSYKYTPSVFAIGERIFGKQPRIITGAGIRPLPLSLKPIKKKKKRRKR